MTYNEKRRMKVMMKTLEEFRVFSRSAEENFYYSHSNLSPLQFFLEFKVLEMNLPRQFGKSSFVNEAARKTPNCVVIKKNMNRFSPHKEGEDYTKCSFEMLKDDEKFLGARYDSVFIDECYPDINSFGRDETIRLLWRLFNPKEIIIVGTK